MTPAVLNVPAATMSSAAAHQGLTLRIAYDATAARGTKTQMAGRAPKRRAIHGATTPPMTPAMATSAYKNPSRGSPLAMSNDSPAQTTRRAIRPPFAIVKRALIHVLAPTTLFESVMYRSPSKILPRILPLACRDLSVFSIVALVRPRRTADARKLSASKVTNTGAAIRTSRAPARAGTTASIALPHAKRRLFTDRIRARPTSEGTSPKFAASKKTNRPCTNAAAISVWSGPRAFSR